MSPLSLLGHVNRVFVARYGPAFHPYPKEGGTVLVVSRFEKFGECRPAQLVGSPRGLIPPPASPHAIMTQWQPPKREPPKTKAELREMLAEAVRNTQPEQPKRRPQAKRDRG
jgi:hypothetical protein